MFKLSDVTEPRFEVDFGPPIGVKSYDPWELAERMDAYASATPADTVAGGLAHGHDAVRRALGIPTSADVDADRRALEEWQSQVQEAGATPPAVRQTISRHACVEVQAALVEFMHGLGALKKLRDLTPS